MVGSNHFLLTIDKQDVSRHQGNVYISKSEMQDCKNGKYEKLKKSRQLPI